MSQDPVSRVIHFRQVAEEVKKGDMMALCVPFGQVPRSMFLRLVYARVFRFRFLSISLHLQLLLSASHPGRECDNDAQQARGAGHVQQNKERH